MRKLMVLLIISFLLFVFCSKTNYMNGNFTNEISSERMLIVLVAPLVTESVYAPYFAQIVDFQIEFAKAVIGKDNIVVIVDRQNKRYYKDKLPEDVLLTARIEDIWVRDFSTINPFNPVQCKYTHNSIVSESDAQLIQKSFDNFANRHDIIRAKSDYYLDGGNIVDNYSGRVITTTRFPEYNNLPLSEAKQILKNLLNATEVAIIKPDEAILAHSDGMVCWIDKDVLLVNDYTHIDSELREKVLEELNASFSNIKIIEVPIPSEKMEPLTPNGFEPACGIHVNAVVTNNYIYVPIFNMPHDNQVINTIRDNTTKTVVTINAEGVCMLGGSARCLSWQLTGENAEKIIISARE